MLPFPHSLDARADTLATKLATLSDDAGAVLEEVRVLTTLASKGEGSMGELMSNPELYQSLTDAAQQLDQLLVEARLLIGKVMTEGMPIDY